MNGIESPLPPGGSVSTQPGPIGVPSNTPAPTGTSDPNAVADPGGGGTGAPTPMPKADESVVFIALSADVRAARQALAEARGKIEASDTVLNELSAQLRALASNPPGRKLRADQMVFFPMLSDLINMAIDLSTPWEIETEEARISRREETHRTLTLAKQIANRIQEL